MSYWRPRSRINNNTLFYTDSGFRAPDEPGVGATQMREACAQAKDLWSEQPSADRPGYRLFWSLGDGHFEAIDLLAGGDEYAVIGRHDACDAVLSADPVISLRHLLARAIVLDDGAVALRLLDLKAGLPFFLEDGVARRSIVSVGPIVVRLGRYVLSAFPLTSGAATGGPYRAAQTLHVESAGVVPRLVAQRLRVTHVTALPPVSCLDEIAPLTSLSSAGRLTLRCGQRLASLEIGHADLERGVVVGRALRCVGSGLHDVLHNGVSRLHLLLLRERESVYAYDLCSVQGSWSGGVPVRRCRLSSQGAALEISASDPVGFVWHPRSVDQQSPTWH